MQESPCEKTPPAPSKKARGNQDNSFEKGALEEADHGASSSNTSSSSSSQNPAPKKEAKTVAEPQELEEPLIK